ncbi:MAG: hypothetical protein VKK04_03575 [Synechococcales bacterium]|nr:hypothetical protein [Synechococcales bacterium]
MLPLLLNELELTPFKFWFDGTVQDGIFYGNELFCRLRSTPLEQRAYLYQYACRLARRNTVVVSLGSENCNLWISLRSPNLADLKPQVDGNSLDPTCS